MSLMMDYTRSDQHCVCVCVSDGKEEGLLDSRRQLSREVSGLKETYERLISRFPNLRFDYK